MDDLAKSLPECKRRKQEKSASPLCTTRQDHSNDFMAKKVDPSFSHELESLKEQLMEEPLVNSLRGSENVVRLQVVSSAFCLPLRDNGIPALLQVVLRFDVFGIENSSLPTSCQKLSRALASPVVVAANDIKRSMGNLDYSLHRILQESQIGEIHVRKVLHSQEVLVITRYRRAL